MAGLDPGTAPRPQARGLPPQPQPSAAGALSARPDFMITGHTPPPPPSAGFCLLQPPGSSRRHRPAQVSYLRLLVLPPLHLVRKRPRAVVLLLVPDVGYDLGQVALAEREAAVAAVPVEPEPALRQVVDEMAGRALHRFHELGDADRRG